MQHKNRNKTAVSEQFKNENISLQQILEQKEDSLSDIIVLKQQNCTQNTTDQSKLLFTLFHLDQDLTAVIVQDISPSYHNEKMSAKIKVLKRVIQTTIENLSQHIRLIDKMKFKRSDLKLIRDLHADLSCRTRDLIDRNLLEQNQFFEQKNHQELIPLIRIIVQSLRVYAEQKQIKIYFTDKTENLIAVQFDQNRVEQVFNSLLGMAIKNSRINSKISVIVENKQIFENVCNFTCFVRYETTQELEEVNIFSALPELKNQTLVQNEIGVGLNLCQNIIQKLNGQIQVQTGYITTFTFQLPLKVINQNYIEIVELSKFSSNSCNSDQTFRSFARKCHLKAESQKIKFIQQQIEQQGSRLLSSNSDISPKKDQQSENQANLIWEPKIIVATDNTDLVKEMKLQFDKTKLQDKIEWCKDGDNAVSAVQGIVKSKLSRLDEQPDTPIAIFILDVSIPMVNGGSGMHVLHEVIWFFENLGPQGIDINICIPKPKIILISSGQSSSQSILQLLETGKVDYHMSSPFCEDDFRKINELYQQTELR